MSRILASRGALARALIGAVAVALLLAFTWKLSHPHAAGADVTQTTAVSAGPDSVSQPAAAGNPSQYESPLERCHTAPNYPLSGANPILSEPLTTKFTSNVPLSVSVTYNGNQWYGTPPAWRRCWRRPERADSETTAGSGARVAP